MKMFVRAIAFRDTTMNQECTSTQYAVIGELSDDAAGVLGREPDLMQIGSGREICRPIMCVVTSLAHGIDPKRCIMYAQVTCDWLRINVCN
jgi:hypothetical protein